MLLEKIKANPNNPRVLKDHKFEKLKKSIQEFPEMLALREIIVDENMVILGGNMRYRALQDLGILEAPVKIAKGLTEEQKKEFIIKDNVGFGEWDWDALANDWDTLELEEWGLETYNVESTIDYSILEDDEVEQQIEDMQRSSKKAIQIEFVPEDYEQAMELINFLRAKDVYIGGLIIDCLRGKKDEL